MNSREILLSSSRSAALVHSRLSISWPLVFRIGKVVRRCVNSLSGSCQGAVHPDPRSPEQGPDAHLVGPVEDTAVLIYNTMDVVAVHSAGARSHDKV